MGVGGYRVMTVNEAAKELGCSSGLVYKLCDQGKIGFHRLGFKRGKITISQRQLEDYRNRCEVSPIPDGFDDRSPRVKRTRGTLIRDRIGEIERRRRGSQ